MPDLVAGANMTLPAGALTVRLPGPYDLCAVVLGADGRVAGDADFVFYNAPIAPGVHVRAGAVEVDPSRLRRGAERVVVTATPDEPGRSFAGLVPPRASVEGAGRTLARLVPPPLRTETVLQLAEIYRRPGPGGSAQWKLRSIGQGYADGLAGIARDFGVVVDDDGTGADAGAQPQGAPARGGDALAEVVRLTNAERTARGLRALGTDDRLARAAYAHSADMAARRFFAHECPSGTQAWDRAVAAGYTYRMVAENIAAGQRTPAEVVEGWMNSPGHRANILNGELTQIGVGFAPGGEYGTYWTQVFGTPR
jgi:stress response protein SCP2